MKKGKLNKSKGLLWGLFILYLIVLINVILLKNGSAIFLSRYMRQLSVMDKLKGINFVPFKTIFYYLADSPSRIIFIENILGNIFAFSPLGFFLPLLFNNIKKLKNIVIIGFMVSFFMEITQLVFSLGSCDIDDIILNILGTIIGFLVYIYLDKYKRHYTKKFFNTN